MQCKKLGRGGSGFAHGGMFLGAYGIFDYYLHMYDILGFREAKI